MIADNAAVQDDAMTHRALHPDVGLALVVRHVSDAAILNAAARCNGDRGVVGPEHGAGPDGRFFPHLDLADQLCCGVDERQRMNLRDMLFERFDWHARHPMLRSAKREPFRRI